MCQLDIIVRPRLCLRRCVVLAWFACSRVSVDAFRLVRQSGLACLLLIYGLSRRRLDRAGDSKNTVRGYCLDIPRFEESPNN